METPTANLKRNHQKKIRSTTSRTKRGRILKKKKKQTQVNFTIVVFINFHYNLFLIFVITTVFNIIFDIAVEIEMDPIPNQHQEENIENITDPELERIEGENNYI